MRPTQCSMSWLISLHDHSGSFLLSLKCQSQRTQVDRVVTAHVKRHASGMGLLLHNDPRQVVPELVFAAIFVKKISLAMFTVFIFIKRINRLDRARVLLDQSARLLHRVELLSARLLQRVELLHLLVKLHLLVQVTAFCVRATEK